MAGAYVSYGFNNKECPVRLIPHPIHDWVQDMELKIPDGTCNPYLVVACMVLAGLDGVWRKIGLPSPTQSDPSDETHIRLPQTLEEAVLVFETNETFKKGLGDKLFQAVLELKRFEIQNPISLAEIIELF